MLYLPMKSAAHTPAKTEERFKEGVFLGVRFRSDEIIIGTDIGVLKARTIKRLTEDQQWDRDFVRRLQGTPKQPDPRVQSDNIRASLRDPGEPEQDLDGDGPSRHAAAQSHAGAPVPQEVNAPRPEPAVRRMYVRKREIERYGETQGCPGCAAIKKGKVATHSDTCRDRVKTAMLEDEEGRKRLKEELIRMDRHMDTEIERQVVNDPELRVAQEAHEEELARSRKRHLCTEESEGAVRELQDKRKRDSPAEGPSEPQGSGDSGVKRKAEEPCAGEEARCEEKQSDDDTVMGNAELGPGPLGELWRDEAAQMYLFDDSNLYCAQSRNRALHEIMRRKPEVVVTDIKDQGGPIQRFLAHVYKQQRDGGRAFLHWDLKQDYTMTKWLDQVGLVKGSSFSGERFTTNSTGIALFLQSGRGTDRALKGWAAQAGWARQGKRLIGVVAAGDAMHAAGEAAHVVPPEEDASEYESCAWDDISGKELDPVKVRAARRLEVEYYQKMDVLDKVPIEECLEVTGKAPIKTKWIDHDKGSRYRSRWVAKEFKDTTDEDWFAATPPLEALRAILSDATTGQTEKAVMLNDVSRAFFYAPVQEHHRIYVDLCDEILEEHEVGRVCGRLKKSMYGTKAAAQNWQRAVQDTMRRLGFKRGKSSAVLFFHPQRGIKTLVHGDDFLSSGRPEDLAWFKGELEAKYDITTTIIGEDRAMGKELKILNRTVVWHDGIGISYEADAKHAEMIIEETGAKTMSIVKTPIAREEGVESARAKEEDVLRRKRSGTLGKKTEGNEDQSLGKASVSKYRAIAARANYLAADRPDIMYAAKELCRKMSSPTARDWDRLVRLGRYLKGRPRVQMWYRLQEEQEYVSTYSDTDWAGCRRTRRSTTGGYSVLGSHVLKTWCKTQATVALSSAEAELYGLVRASAETLSTIAMYQDFGTLVKGCILGDASAALAIIQRQGLGKMRHLDTSYLWVQEKALNDELKYRKVAGVENGADLFTKVLTWEEIKGHIERMHSDFIGAETTSILRREVHSLLKRMGPIAETRCWTRTDLCTRRAKGTMRGGPEWDKIVGRVAVDAESGEVLLCEDVRGVARIDLNRPVSLTERDVITGLVFIR